MADASLDTWAVAEPRVAGGLVPLDREIRRVGTASVRGGMAALLNSLHPRLTYRDGMFTYTPPCNPRLALGPMGPVGPRRLALVPMIARRKPPLFQPERPYVCYIGYPIPAPARAHRPRPAARSPRSSARCAPPYFRPFASR